MTVSRKCTARTTSTSTTRWWWWYLKWGSIKSFIEEVGVVIKGKGKRTFASKWIYIGVVHIYIANIIYKKRDREREGSLPCCEKWVMEGLEGWWSWTWEWNHVGLCLYCCRSDFLTQLNSQIMLSNVEENEIIQVQLNWGIADSSLQVERLMRIGSDGLIRLVPKLGFSMWVGKNNHLAILHYFYNPLMR